MILKKFKIPKEILYLLVFSVLLNIARIFLFNNIKFIYIVWNIFLASIPFLISIILSIYTNNKKNLKKPFFIIGLLLWFLFLPNAPYVITDFIHLGRISGVPIMYDTFLLFTSALVSLLMGLYSIINIEKILLLKFSKKIVNITIFIVIFFAGFGIYLGRFLRFNSWDVFTSFEFLYKSIIKIFTNSNDYLSPYLYTLLFFSFIYISYLSFKNIKNESN